MSVIVQQKFYTEPPFCEKEMLRYAGCRSSDEQVEALLHECLQEIGDNLSYRVCFAELSVSVRGDVCDFGIFTVTSSALSKLLRHCSRVIVFAATIGIEIDRMIARYSRISPAKSVLMQGIGAERVEALCDRFCTDIDAPYKTPRFSPGYGDLPLETQQSIFAVLDCEKKIGVCLNDSLLMSPSKSVTAFVGLCDIPCAQKASACARCQKSDCAFRGDI